MSSNFKTTSKFLSLILRHEPETIGLVLDDKGWANIDEIIAKSSRPLTRKLIDDIVRTNDKQRFIISDDGQRIRANQGHSINVNLELTPCTPPPTLYHGTATRFWGSIASEGLKPMNRNHVHLSADIETAVKVGSRHGKPTILVIDTGTMHAKGHQFFQSENGVWLTKIVPIEYINS